MSRELRAASFQKKNVRCRYAKDYVFMTTLPTTGFKVKVLVMSSGDFECDAQRLCEMEYRFDTVHVRKGENKNI